MHRIHIKTRLRQWMIIILGFGLVLAISYFVFVTRTKAENSNVSASAPQGQSATQSNSSGQPIEFNHQAMVGLGIGCLYCHGGATHSAVAGLPSVELCMGCHKAINPGAPAIQEVKKYYDAGQPIPWKQVNVLPRFVYFSHEVHVNKGINCERCHGDVAHMTVDVQVVKMTMGWCLNCHSQQPNAPQLRDCIICHQ
jgi:c(7)-type cytochrome triheme protein